METSPHVDRRALLIVGAGMLLAGCTGTGNQRGAAGSPPNAAADKDKRGNEPEDEGVSPAKDQPIPVYVGRS